MTAGRGRILASTLACVAVLGAGAPANASEPAARKAASASKPMHVAPMKSNGSGIILSYRIDGTPKAGSPVSVVLRMDGVTDPAGATVRWVAGTGLSLVSPSQTSQMLASGVISTLAVQVIPAGEGVGYLDVFTTQYGAISAMSIPVQVGKAPTSLPATGELKQTPSGEKIVPMPVK